MAPASLEHANITVANLERSTQMLIDLFGWHVRWKGPSKDGGTTAHVGSDDQYIALYSKGSDSTMDNTYETIGGLNHIGVVVDNLDAMEAKVKALGYQTHNHGDYEPGRRFYFDDHDGIEFELVQYD
ncbi:VOC family protein [Cohaesibacter intestini]|uniref:VOC family protein n=1 Tax=Cohaesibacter intestini TaxID=2211145 RepID=UPI000DEA4202|nr:VOC family protein [Cohaesibacter intestini]